MGLLDLLRLRRQRLEAPSIPEAALPPGGRSSIDSPNTLMGGMAAYLREWDGIEPLLPPEYLDQIVRMAVINPDMSQAVSNWVALGNPGHDLVLVGDPEIMDGAYRRLNRKARTLAPHTAGIDGLVNKYLEQVATTGAISSEDVVRLGSDPGVSHVAIVPPTQIRFRREGQQYVPYQQLGLEEVALNPITYRYLAYMTIENSPYAKPPMVAAIEPILDQRRMKKNLQFILKKFGLFGLISAAVTPPKQEPRETWEEYQKRVQGHLQDVLRAFKENFHEGMAVHTDNIKVERTNVTSDARGIQELFRLNEEQVFSGLGTVPAMHGRTYSTTETYARVVYGLLLRQTEGFQRPVKRRIERTYQLDLALAGIPVEDVSLHFHKARSQDPLTDARARQLEWQVLREKVETGLVDPDSAARALGYDRWEDATQIKFSGDKNLQRFPALTTTLPLEERLHRLVFDTAGQRYRPVRRRVALELADHSAGGSCNPAGEGNTVEKWLTGTQLPAANGKTAWKEDLT